MTQYEAHYEVQKAVNSGVLVKPYLCEECEERRAIDFHHRNHDYSKPLDGVWLCRSCHRKINELLFRIQFSRRLYDVAP